MNNKKTGFLHIPRTGGTYLEALLQSLGPSKFINFFGTPEDQLRNRISLIERIASNQQAQSKLHNIISDDEVKVFSGHFSLNIAEFLPKEYDYQYFTILRDPVERTISFIKKVTSSKGFAAYMTKGCQLNDDKFWNNFYRYINDKSSQGLMTHEIHGFSNYMTKVLCGADLSSESISLNDKDYDVAFNNLNSMLYVGNFADYSVAINDILNIFNVSARPNIRPKNKHTYDIPNNIIDFISDINSYDLKLYRQYFS